jgi:hypothetical protein
VDPIDQEQAVLLRSIRKETVALFGQAHLLSAKPTTFVCPHEVYDQPETGYLPDRCFVCAIFEQLTTAQLSLKTAYGLIDAALERGPAPAEGGAK